MSIPANTPLGRRILARGRVRHTPGRMNKTEAAYASLLDVRKLAGEIADWRFEAVKLRLADKTFLTPDFFVLLADGAVEFHEVKGGFMEDDSAVKNKVAAALYPMFVFRLVRRRKGAWQESIIGNLEAS